MGNGRLQFKSEMHCHYRFRGREEGLINSEEGSGWIWKGKGERILERKVMIFENHGGKNREVDG